MPLATVREAIEFSARTRLPESVSLFTKMRKVDEVLKLLDLEGKKGYIKKTKTKLTSPSFIFYLFLLEGSKCCMEVICLWSRGNGLLLA